MRFFHFGEALQNMSETFATWQLITGEPHLLLGSVPDSDLFTLQIDTYSNTRAEAEQAGLAVRNAFEQDMRCTVTRYNAFGKENETNLYRVSFDVDFIENRSK